ncbi:MULTISPECIES: endonuclease/exonuclease/phosphatase family protein [Alphaproteobacteria]|uniref:Endonuclease n=2 Tax=Alphaproteobacteria TaxID=28211 RepID=A0A512HEU7_9HYPH|nr:MULTISPECIES: endonuclease/exonuclease/phosphatase family protein [Alphaproteobacteria]GEO83880.1 endonuclease [Ciceribacter naphthalenivorans]GLR21242.1 endonuclease [Ciceribacter naphthalenivorans]GLT04098.1 endonuclease [Sphingomonas psychrolutea]
MPDLKVATFNLYHFAEPGIFWHERKASATYTPEQWAAKLAWISGVLAKMDADVIGFQEVVSDEALRTLTQAAGYPYFYNAARAIFDPDDAAVYVNATVAIASRLPFTAVNDLAGVAGVPEDTVIDAGFSFSRVPVEAVVAAPGVGEIRIYVCHLKSQGAFVDPDEIDVVSEWAEKVKRYYALRAMAGVDQVAKRAAEAGALYRTFRRTLDVDPEAAVILLGDMNEDPESHTLGILTQGERVFSWGSVAGDAIPEAFAYLKHVFKLYDAWHLVPTQQNSRPVTHSSFGHGSVLDYVILSNGLNPKNPRRHGTVSKIEVFDDHFRDGPPRGIASDHAPVVATIASAATV